MKDKMAELRAKGILFKDIGIKMGVSSSTIRYHLNPAYKERIIHNAKAYWKKLDPKVKTKIYKSRREYLRLYQNRKYKESPEWRKRRIDCSIAWQSKMKKKKK